MATRTTRKPVVQEIKLDEAVTLLKSIKADKREQWKRVVTMVRDPEDLTRIISVSMNEK